MKKNEARIIFMGTPSIAATVLKGLLDNGYNICLVVTNVDKVHGRKNTLMPSEVKKIALEYGIEVFQPVSIRKDYQKIYDVNPDLIVTCAYGQIVPKEVLDAPKIGCINVHGSILPKLRGASPIQSALFEGLKVTGVTIMEMEEKMDAGAMYHKKEITIDENDNYTSLYEKIAVLGKDALLEMIDSYIDGTINGIPQDESEATFCKKILPEDEHLSLENTNEEFINRVRGLSNTPGGYVLFNDKKLKIYGCKNFSNATNDPIGKLVKIDKNTLTLQLKYGKVQLLTVQKESKNVMDAKSFMNGERNLNDLYVK